MNALSDPYFPKSETNLLRDPKLTDLEVFAEFGAPQSS